ncbi:hypothetical protein N8000_05910, partial [Rhodospirillales bacterium]|nr:hypothetical protein [Rhodospirillales bacterium]
YAEIVFRAVIAQPNRSEVIDTTLFPYHPYLISTQPPNLVLGNSDNILEGYFGHSRCDGPNGVTARFNSKGFRSPEFPESGSKDASTIRVLIVGGSASISWNIGEACTLDRVIQSSLDEKFSGKNIEIYNLGSAAWKSFQELSAVQLYGPIIEPDIIVHFSGFNDINHAATMPINYGYSENMIQRAFDRYVSWTGASVKNFFQEFRLGYFLRNLFVFRHEINSDNTSENELPAFALKAGPTQVATSVSFPINFDMISKRTDFDPYIGAVVTNYIQQEKFLHGTSQALNANLITVLQPALYFKKPRSEVENRLIKGPYLPLLNFTALGYLRLMENLEGLTENTDSHVFMNLSRVFNGSSETFFGDAVHFSAEGYEIVGKLIANEAEKILILKN